MEQGEGRKKTGRKKNRKLSKICFWVVCLLGQSLFQLFFYSVSNASLYLGFLVILAGLRHVPS